MKKFRDSSLQEYLNVLASREPVPGGGSVAALAAALGAGLISMVTQYSLNKGSPLGVERKLMKILEQSEMLRGRFLELVDLDSEAYLEVVKARKGTEEEKKVAAQRAAAVPRELAKLCYKAVTLTPYLVVKGNKYLLSDVEVAVELLNAAYQSAGVMSREG